MAKVQVECSDLPSKFKVGVPPATLAKASSANADDSVSAILRSLLPFGLRHYCFSLVGFCLPRHVVRFLGCDEFLLRYHHVRFAFKELNGLNAFLITQQYAASCVCT